MITTIDPKLLRAIASVLAHPFAYPSELGERTVILRPVALDVTFDASFDGVYVPDSTEADVLTTATMCAVMSYCRSRLPRHVGLDDIAVAILDAEGPLLTWWCTELAKHLPAAAEEPAP